MYQQAMVVFTVFLATVGTGAQEPPTKPAAGAPAEPGAPRHKELGAVRWLRDFDAALAESTRSGKPVLILFDEVPGCATCVGFGETVLTHPLIVEAAEELFVPVAVFNNVEGADRKVLLSFNEPTWNNPVVRIVDAERKDLVTRVDGDYTSSGILGAMTAALKKAGRPVPRYLSILQQETGALGDARAEKAVFAMHCFWEGEANLGAIEGVLSTRTGFADGKEVVEVTFDRGVLPRQTLLAKAQEASCTVTPTDAVIRPSPKDDKYRLRGAPYAALPMTPAQATRVNAALSKGEDPKALLSPRQLRLLERLERVHESKRPNMLGRTDLAVAWREATDAAR